MQPAEQLARGLDALGLAVSPGDQRRLLRFVELLAKWNRVYNLTAVTDPNEMVARHLLDSLAVAPHLRGPRVADVGTGAGLPGIPLAVTRPELAFTLIDSAAKKVRFVRQAVLELGLANVTVEQVRAQDYRPAQGFDTVIARAFAELGRLVEHAAHLLAPGGRLLAMKGSYPSAELNRLPAGFRVEAVTALRVPAYPGERHLVIIAPVDDCAGAGSRAR